MPRHEIHIYLHVGESGELVAVTTDQPLAAGGQADQIIDASRKASRAMEAPLREQRRVRTWQQTRRLIKRALIEREVGHEEAAALFDMPRSSFSTYMSSSTHVPNAQRIKRMVEWLEAK
jgi:hypothetical protein